MAIEVEVIRHHWCDLHLEAGEYIEGKESEPIVHDGKAKVVDLDDDCRAVITYSEMMELVKRSGRVVDLDDKKPKFACDECGQEFATAQGRATHMTRKHKPEEPEESDDSEGDIIGVILDSSPETAKSYVCPDCDQEFASHHGLNGHKATHRPRVGKA